MKVPLGVRLHHLRTLEFGEGLVELNRRFAIKGLNSSSSGKKEEAVSLIISKGW